MDIHNIHTHRLLYLEIIEALFDFRHDMIMIFGASHAELSLNWLRTGRVKWEAYEYSGK